MSLKCPICDRDLGETLIDKHHLIPKTFKGKETVDLHKICHQKIHSVFAERELLNYYNTVDRILENEDIKEFAKWVKGKQPSFYTTSRETNSRKSKRRR